LSVGFWIANAIAFAVGPSLMVGLWVILVGSVAASQKAACETALFSFVRTYGLRHTAARLAWMIVTCDRRLRDPRFRGWQRLARPVTTIAAVVMVTTCLSLVAAFFLPYRDFKAVGASPLRGLVIGAVASLAACTYFWMAGLSYAAKPSKARKKGRLPRIELPYLSQQAQDDLAIRVFWYLNLNRAFFMAMIFPWFYVVATWLGAPKYPAPPSSWNSFLGPGLIIASTACPSQVAKWLYRRLIFEQLTVAACALLNPVVPPKAAGSLGEIGDPLKSRRLQLAKLGVLLTEAARQLDERQPTGARPHPVATLLRAAATRLSEFLRSQRSWSGTVPRGILDLPRLILAVIATPTDPGAFEELSRRLQAFDRTGSPQSESVQGQPGKLLAFARRANAGVAETASTVKALGVIAVIVIVVILLILHRTSLNGMLPYLHQ
jgi:hypothetical protein